MKKRINIKKATLIFLLLFIGIIALDLIFMNDNYYEGRFFKMDTQITIKGEGYHMDLATRDILKAIDEIDAEFNAHNVNSTLYTLNTKGSAEFSEDGLYLLKLADEVSEKSEKAFDIKIKPILDVWGFGTEFPAKPNDALITEAISALNSSELTIEKNKVTLKNGKIDLGGIAKGFATDKAREILNSYNEIDYAVLDFGGNIFTYGKKPDGSKFKIGIDDGKKGVFATVSVENSFVITSGGYERCFEENGKTYHHIIDPKTGYPAQSGLVSVTIISDNGALGDALSTACYILGVEKGMELAENYNVKAVFLDDNNDVYIAGDVDIELVSDDYSIIN